MVPRVVLCTCIVSASALRLPPLRPGGAARCAPSRCGFSVQTLEQKQVDELDVFNWPGLEKRTADFERRAGADELSMVYVKEGAALVSDADGDEAAVAAGTLVTISDGAVAWSGISEGGLVLLVSPTMSSSDGEAGGGGAVAAAEADAHASLGEQLKEAGVMLGAGLLFGGLLAVVANLARGM